ncbi:MAG: helix-turn-helix domain-containing protein [Acidobacteriota bacterium]
MSITKKGGKRANTESEEGEYPEGLVVPESTIRNRRVQIVIDFMNANLQRRISLTELADAANLSPTHLSRLFKNQTKLSPGEYLIKLRMKKARHLLATSLLSIKQIMALVGYSDRSNFVRHFKRYFGLLPSEYRKHAFNNHLLQNGKIA